MFLRLALAAAALTAAPAFAASYSGTPAAAPAEQRIIARNIVWTCGATDCRGATEASRPAVLCQSLAKRAGRLESFLVDGRAFSAVELDRCNAVADDGKNPALANAR